MMVVVERDIIGVTYGTKIHVSYKKSRNKKKIICEWDRFYIIIIIIIIEFSKI